MSKRIFDLVVGLVLLVIALPIMAAVAVAVWAKLGLPIVFRQERPGIGGRPFVLLKFRTMREAFDASGMPLPDSSRLTPFGMWLRRTSLDELPALINVLKGEMSLVGPSPLLLEYLPLYNEFQARRHDVKPGISGWAQVHGRNSLTWEEKFALDVWYVENRSLLLDIMILCMTVAKVCRADGITQAGSVSAEKFKGSAG